MAILALLNRKRITLTTRSRAKAASSPKSEIERQQDPILGDGLVENLLIGAALETFVPKVKSVMSLAPEFLHDRDGHAHIGEEAHEAGSRECELLRG